MNLAHRIDLLARLGEYILSPEPSWILAKEKASYENGWFIPQFIDTAVSNISHSFLSRKILETWAKRYQISQQNAQPKTIGLVLAGNIPLVGFHDFLCVFVTGNRALIKPSSKDETLLKHLGDKLIEWDAELTDHIQFAPLLKGCDAYITTGSNNSARYFEYYFKKYPHIIRRNRTSVAILNGKETDQQLEKLSDDVNLYFGLGCRNVTKIYVPTNYDFIPLLAALKKYNYFFDHHKYRNNYDYNLAIHLLNNKYYMSTGSMLLVDDTSIFSPISQLNYEYYKDQDNLHGLQLENPDIQCIVGEEQVPFGKAQYPTISEYADGTDTVKFLCGL